MTKEEFVSEIEKVAKIKLTNYRLTSNDLAYMIDSIYNEIASRVTLGFIEQDVVIDSDVEWYDLDALYVVVGEEKPMNTISIVDSNGYDISKFFTEKGLDTFRLSSCEIADCCETICIQDGDIVTFNRKVIPDIDTLDESIQMALLSTVTEGMMYHFHDALPNPTASNTPMGETNFHYQRYYNSIQGLMNLFPQVI